MEVRRIRRAMPWSHSLLVKRWPPGDVISQTQLPGFQSLGLAEGESQIPGFISRVSLRAPW
jgi:hypothetical protein